MRFFKYLIFIFFYLISSSAYSMWYADMHFSGQGFESYQSLCSHLESKNPNNQPVFKTEQITDNKAYCYYRSSADPNSTVFYYELYKKQTACKADGSTVTAGSVTVSNWKDESEYLDLTDQASSKFAGSYICSSGCKYDFDYLSGDGDQETGPILFTGIYKKTAQTCSSGGGSAPNTSLTGTGGTGGGNDGGGTGGGNDGGGTGGNDGGGTGGTGGNDGGGTGGTGGNDGGGTGGTGGNDGGGTGGTGGNDGGNDGGFDSSSIINSIKSMSDRLQNSISSMSDRLQNSIKSMSDTLNDTFNDLKATQLITNQKLDATNSLLDGMKGLLNDLKTSVSQVASKLDTTNQKLTDLNNAQQATNQKLDAANKNLSDLKDGQAKTNEHLDKIDKNGKETNQKLDGIKDGIDALTKCDGRECTDADFNNILGDEDTSLNITPEDVLSYKRENHLSFGSTCPFSAKVTTIDFGISSFSFTTNLSFICDFGHQARPYVIAIGHFACLIFLLIGIRNGSTT